MKTDALNPVYFFNQKTEIKSTFTLIETGNSFQSMTIVAEDAKEMKKQLFKEYRIVKAAGGCVINSKKEVMMILRNGMWDLPKGKMEKGEKKRDCALREVREETGVEKIEILQKLMRTFHTYTAAENEKILKKTQWYLMECFEDAVFKPQKEEGIEAVEWIDAERLQEKMKYTYKNVKAVLDDALIAILMN